MKTKEMIEYCEQRIKDLEGDKEEQKMFVAIIKRLEELDELRGCSVRGEDGEWIHLKDIQLLTNIVKE